MITLEEADLLFTILTLVFAFAMLATFTGAVFSEKQRRKLAIITGICAGLLLLTMILALASPYWFTS
ncbi:MAG: hypothetical protein LUQ65_11535 [Candidatus Helarchaeota archaeon]|nr:hypothetical protein [Candidatus Helarchaeota archaeon]